MIEQHNWYFTGLTSFTSPRRQKPGTYNTYRVIHCTYNISAWIMEQDPAEWVYIPIKDSDAGPAYWVSDSLVLLLTLRWPVTYTNNL